MGENWIFIGAALFFAVIFIVFLVRRNLKDKEDTEKFFNEEYGNRRKPEPDEDEFGI